MRTLNPWIGTNYFKEGLDGVRLLIIGESHYGARGDERAEFTSAVVKEWGQDKRSSFFTKNGDRINEAPFSPRLRRSDLARNPDHGFRMVNAPNSGSM